MSGKLGEAAKKHLVDIKSKMVIINANPTALSTTDGTAATAASQNVVSGGKMISAAEVARFEELEKMASMAKKPNPWSLNC